jgi:spore coat polysaccharide biosynthesis protein SpsF
MILRQLERLERSTMIDALVVATSVDSSDDSLVATLESAGVAVRRGPLDDVLERFNLVVREFEPDTIVRLTADCPLADPLVIDDVIRAHLHAGVDYTSNTLPPTYPDGLDVECIGAAAFERLLTLPLTAREREHLTMGIYSRPAVFVRNTVEQEPDLSHLRWTVDLPEDLEFVEAVYESLYANNAAFGQADILHFLGDRPELTRTDQDVARNAGSAQ